MDPVLRRGELRVGVRTESEEGDVTEIEQARVPDDKVEPETEQDVQEREDPVGEEVAAVHPEGERRGGCSENCEPAGRRNNLDEPGDYTEDAPAALTAILDLGNPIVDANTRLVTFLGRRRQIGDVAARAHSDLLDRARTEQTARPYEQDEDENGEDDQVRPPAAEVPGRIGLLEADEDAPEHRPRNAADAAHDGCRE